MRNSEEEATPLQLKLNVLADQIGKFGFLAAGLMFM
jgi:Ca2+-transporting ATPase